MRGGGAAYNRDVISQFLCAHHGVANIWDFLPFGDRYLAFEMLRPVTLTVESRLQHVVFSPHRPSESQVITLPLINDPAGVTRFLGRDGPAPAPERRFKHPETQQPMPLDFDRVYPYSVVTRHLASSVPWPVAIRLNFYHQGKELLEHRAEHDAMMAAGGAIRGAYATIQPTGAGGQDVEVAAMPYEPFAFRNDFFTGTMALVNESNLQNGVVIIPPNVCIQAGLPVFRGRIIQRDDDDAGALANAMMDMSISETEQKLMETAKKRELRPISDWRAIPINHVLAWGMQSDEFARERGLRVYPFSYSPNVPPDKNGKRPDDITLYYLVDNVAYAQLLEYFRVAWMGKVDVRPLSSMAFELLPMQAQEMQRTTGKVPEQVTGNLTVQSSISYMVAPKLSEAQIAVLAPALHPEFPSCRQWNPFKMPYLEDDNEK